MNLRPFAAWTYDNPGMTAFLIVAAFALGFIAGPQAKQAFDEDREARIVWGTTPDDARPWDPRACLTLSQSISSMQWAKEAGAVKSRVMRKVQTTVAAEDDAGEIVGELSRAWDRDTPGPVFLQTCLKAAAAAAADALRRRDRL